MNYFNYFSEIEETFIRLRGKNLLLSPLDWALIEAWKEREMPLHVVLRAIETVFENAAQQPARRRNIKSLMYCREEVEAQFAEWLSKQVGSEATAATKEENSSTQNGSQNSFSSEQILAHLNQAETHLREVKLNLNHNWQSVTARILRELKQERENFLRSKYLEKLETRLEELDHLLDETLLESFPANKLAEIKTETAAQLRSHKARMTEEAYRQTFRTLLIKSLREHTDLPRFSLYYL